VSVSLQAATLSVADLINTDLAYADLSSADLREAMGWTVEELNKARLDDATMPDGQILKGPVYKNMPTFTEWRKSISRREAGENSRP
jgi:uncharacterized protein YjbI with pentapeptide repeats